MRGDSLSCYIPGKDRGVGKIDDDYLNFDLPKTL